MVQQTSRGLEVEAEVAWGRPGFFGTAIHGGAETKLPNIEMRPGAQSPKIRPSSSQRQQGGPEKSKPAGFVADGQFQPKCLGSEFSRQIAVDFESNANLHKRGSCPGHSHLPFLSEERQTYSGPFQVARSAGRDMRQLPCGRIDCGVPERVRPMCLSARSLIDESALIAACSMRQAREATTSIQGGHQATCPCLPGYSARLRGHAGNRTHTRPQSATCAERAVRLLSPRLLVVPRSASRCQFIRPRRVVSRHWSLRAA